MNYRDCAPEYLKDITSDGIISFFEDERATKEERQWFKDIIFSEEYRLHANPISKYNWGKIKTTFVKQYFPALAPKETKNKISIEDRLINLFK